MGWARKHIEKLITGETVTFKPKGNSMQGKIRSGQVVIVEPVNKELKVDDIILCKVKGNEYLHLIKAIKEDRYLIGNNVGRINGYIGKNSIFGICTKVGE